MRQIVLVAHNLRSTHNAGSLLRTAEGLGVGKIWLTGYSPYPQRETARETRLPHLAAKIDKQIAKTALGAQKSAKWAHAANTEEVIKELKQAGYKIAGLEQAKDSISLPDFKPPEKTALIVGSEVEGIEPGILEMCDYILEIPMFGKKESYNVVQAAAMALYHCRFTA